MDELTNDLSQLNVNRGFIRREEMEEQQNQQEQIFQGVLGCIGDLRQGMQSDRAEHKHERDQLRAEHKHERDQLRAEHKHERDQQNQINLGILGQLGDLKSVQVDQGREIQHVKSVQANQGREFQDIKSVQANQGRKIQDVQSEIAKSAKKAHRRDKQFKALTAALGVKMDLSSPDSAVDSAASTDKTETGK